MALFHAITPSGRSPLIELDSEGILSVFEHPTKLPAHSPGPTNALKTACRAFWALSLSENNTATRNVIRLTDNCIDAALDIATDLITLMPMIHGDGSIDLFACTN